MQKQVRLGRALPLRHRRRLGCRAPAGQVGRQVGDRVDILSGSGRTKPVAVTALFETFTTVPVEIKQE